jgi:hypothetical protein
VEIGNERRQPERRDPVQRRGRPTLDADQKIGKDIMVSVNLEGHKLFDVCPERETGV